MARKDDELEKQRQQKQLVPACGGYVLSPPPFDDEHYYQSLDSGTLVNNILIEILQRLPAKSLLRFRAVCKSWCAFISNSSSFSKKHLRYADSSILFSLMPPLSVDCKALLKDDGPVEGRKLKLQNRYKQNKGRNANIVGSCNGLICLLLQWGYVVLWNRCTGEVNKLPKQALVKKPTFYGFGYDSRTERYSIIFGYKLTRSTVSRAAIFTRSWRRFDDIEIHTSILGAGCLLKGALHWIDPSHYHRPVPSRSCIVSFDLAKEKFQKLVCLPPIVNWETEVNVWTSRDSMFVCFCHRTNPEISIWEMKEYGIEDSWTKIGQISISRFHEGEYYLPLKLLQYGNGKILGSGFSAWILLAWICLDVFQPLDWVRMTQ